MLTARGWWFAIVAGLVAVVGVFPAAQTNPSVAVLGVTLVVWFLFEWVRFAARFRDSATRLTVTRSLWQSGRQVTTGWAKVPCQVRVTLATDGRFRLPVVFLTDRVPAGVTPVGDTSAVAELTADDPLKLVYELKPPAPGVLRFEGVAVRVTDRCGLFYRRLFVRDRAEFLILPPLTDEDGKQRAHKRFNTLPTPGAHRLKRPGGGSELLDLRDYRPGDPPKMIAWKPSARRDKLIIKEYESDVPVRCTLFLDTSPTVRDGPPGRTPLVRLVDVAAAVGQSAAGVRDFVGLTVFDHESATTVPPARSTTHTVRLMAKLAEAAALDSHHRPGPADQMRKYAYPLAQELYPDLLAADLNTRPFGLYWIPLQDTKYGWLALSVMLAPLVVVLAALADIVWAVSNGQDIRGGLSIRFLLGVADVIARVAREVAGRGSVLFVFAVICLVLPAMAGVFWVCHGLRGFLPPRKTHTRQRKQLAALFASLDGDTPAAVERYLRDDAAFSARAAAFLADHHVRVPAVGQDLGVEARGRAKAEVLAAQLTRAVTLARDNEVYVLFLDPSDLGDHTEPILAAVRRARGRHHHVVVVVPWPEGIPVPNEPKRGKVVATAVKGAKPGRLRIAQLVQAGLVRSYQRQYTAFRSQLVRVGATVVRVTDADAVRVVLDRIEHVRTGGLRR